MATLAGVFCAVVVNTYRPAELADALDAPRQPYAIMRSFPPLNAYGGTGPRSGDGMVSELPRTLSGLRAPGVRDDLFDRMYIYPTSIDVGNLTGIVTRDISIWNTFERTAVCVDVERIGMDGISTTFNYSGFSIGGLSGVLEHVVFAMDGPPMIAASLIFHFTIGTEERSVRAFFAGRRIVAWVWRPQTPMREGLEWVTSILEGRDGSEQRIRLRNCPRQSWELDFQISGMAALQTLEVALYGWQSRSWAVPNWAEATILQGPIAAGTLSLSFDTTTSDYREDGLIMLWTSDTVNEVLQISEVAANGISLYLPVAVNFPAGPVLAMPIRIARMVEPARRTDNVTGDSSFSCQFLVTDNSASEGAPSEVQYQNMDVLLDPQLSPDTTVKREISRHGNKLDYTTGLWTVDSHLPYSSATSEMRWERKTRASAWALRQWLHRRAGRLTPFWMPTWREDLTLVATVPQASSTIRVRDTGYSRLLLGNIMRKHIMIELKDGSRYFREILGAATGDAGEEVVTINAALGVVVAPSDVKRISWLVLHRLDADAVVLLRQSAQRLSVAVPIKEIEQ